ncbi:hypothetical protein, partial [Shewanella algae]|uniref:hypothetical protein n=1 Tax=Shewanella algae TaxID=38313 RepID=UPI001C579D32
GALDKQSPLPGVVWNTTTLGRWHSGYHGFKPKLTNELALSCQLNCSPSPAVRFRTDEPVTQHEQVPVSMVTVPPVSGNGLIPAISKDSVPLPASPKPLLGDHLAIQKPSAYVHQRPLILKPLMGNCIARPQLAHLPGW